jgi:hypothetical protein
VGIDEVTERLYALPANEFVRARDEAARELRQAGRRVEAERVKELRKPTAAAAAVNRLVREHRGELEEFLAAAAALRDAQFGQKGDVRAAGAREREALELLVRAGGEQVRQSLQAAAVDKEAAQELLAGRLERELESRGFGSLLADAGSIATRSRKTPTPRMAVKRPDSRAAQAKLREAKQALAQAETDARRAEREWEKAQGQVRRARAAVEKAQAELDRVRAG